MYIPRSHLTMVNWRVIFCEIISVIVCYYVPIYSNFLKHFLVSQPVSFHIPCFWTFWFHDQVENPSVVEFSGLRGVAGCLWSNVINASCIPIAVLPLLKVPHVSTSSAEDTTLRIFKYYVCIGQLISGIGLIRLGKGQLLR